VASERWQKSWIFDGGVVVSPTIKRVCLRERADDIRPYNLHPTSYRIRRGGCPHPPVSLRYSVPSRKSENRWEGMEPLPYTTIKRRIESVGTTIGRPRTGNARPYIPNPNPDNPPPSARDHGDLFQTVPNRTKRRHATRKTSKNPRNCEKNIKFFAKNTSISFIYMV